MSGGFENPSTLDGCGVNGIRELAENSRGGLVYLSGRSGIMAWHQTNGTTNQESVMRSEHGEPEPERQYIHSL